MREIPKLREMMNRWDDEFHEIFNLHVNYFAGRLVLFGIADFDVVKFDDYLHKLGYREEKDGNMKSYITKRWGKRACELITELIKAR